MGVVVRHPGPGVGPGDLEVGQELGDSLRGHRGAAVSVHDLRGAVQPEHVPHHLLGEQPGLVGVDPDADDVAGVDVDHHVRVEVAALHRPGEFGDVPGVHLGWSGRDQFRHRPGRVAGDPAPLDQLRVVGQDPIQGRDRA